jgi:hypothetical protein
VCFFALPRGSDSTPFPPFDSQWVARAPTPHTPSAAAGRTPGAVVIFFFYTLHPSIPPCGLRWFYMYICFLNPLFQTLSTTAVHKKPQDDIQEAPPQATKSKAQAELTCLRAREPPSKTICATRRYDGTKIGSEITSQRNSECRRLAPDNSNPHRFSRGLDLR